jgi:hypothetical protein
MALDLFVSRCFARTCRASAQSPRAHEAACRMSDGRLERGGHAIRAAAFPAPVAVPEAVKGPTPEPQCRDAGAEPSVRWGGARNAAFVDTSCPPCSAASPTFCGVHCWSLSAERLVAPCREPILTILHGWAIFGPLCLCAPSDSRMPPFLQRCSAEYAPWPAWGCCLLTSARQCIVSFPIALQPGSKTRCLRQRVRIKYFLPYDTATVRLVIRC